MRTNRTRFAWTAVALVAASGMARGQSGYTSGVLIANQSTTPGFVSGQTLIDPNLKDPWGFSFTKTGPFWVSDQASNATVNGVTSPVTTLYGVSQAGVASPIPLVVNVPNQGGAAADPSTFGPIGNGPTGQVSPFAPGIATSPTDFQVSVGGKAGEATFIFANLDGSIAAWKGGLSGTLASIVVAGGNPNTGGASYTGLAIGNDPSAVSASNSNGVLLYAANQNGGINVFDNKFAPTTLAGGFSDPDLPKGYTAFNVQNLNGNIYVTYANQNGASPGGIVDAYTTNGALIGGTELINDRNGLWLNQAYGLALAPKGWGPFGGDLLVGNNDVNGWISAYSPITGAFQGFLTGPSGALIGEDGLWSLSFGNGGNAGSPNTLFFTAGANNVDGAFGSINPVPEPSTFALLGLGAAFGLRRRLIRRPAGDGPISSPRPSPGP